MHFIAKEETAKMRKNVLLVDNNSEFENLLRTPLTQTFADSQILLNIVRAKDGPDAANKSENQKFDVVLIDTEVPRMMDGGFIYSLTVNKNIKQASILVVSHKKTEELHENLQKSKIFQKPVSAQEIIDFMVRTINVGVSPSSLGSSKAAVDARMINAVIQSTFKVWNDLGVPSVTLDKAESCPSNAPLRGEISSLVEIKSKNFRGFLAVTFENESFLEIVNKMLNENHTEVVDGISDAAGELNNMILGNAKSELTHYGFEMTTPKVVKGRNCVLPCPEGSAAMMVPFKTAQGRFFLVITASAKS